MKSTALVIIGLVLALISSSQAGECGDRVFRPANAFESASVSYRTVRRRGLPFKEVTKAEVVWNPLDLLEGKLACYNLSAVSLWYRPVDDVEWIRSESAMWPGKGKETGWRLDDIKPCLEYEFNVLVPPREMGHGAIVSLSSLGPATDEEVAESGYVPEAPSAFAVDDEGGESVKVSWARSDCAHSYEFHLRKAGGDEEWNATVLKGAAVLGVKVNGVKPGAEYEVAIRAALGDRSSDELVGQFNITKGSIPVDSNEEVESLIVEDGEFLTFNLFSTYKLLKWPSASTAMLVVTGVVLAVAVVSVLLVGTSKGTSNGAAIENPSSPPRAHVSYVRDPR